MKMLVELMVTGKRLCIRLSLAVKTLMVKTVTVIKMTWTLTRLLMGVICRLTVWIRLRLTVKIWIRLKLMFKIWIWIRLRLTVSLARPLAWPLIRLRFLRIWIMVAVAGSTKIGLGITVAGSTKIRLGITLMLMCVWIRLLTNWINELNETKASSKNSNSKYVGDNDHWVWIRLRLTVKTLRDSSSKQMGSTNIINVNKIFAKANGKNSNSKYVGDNDHWVWIRLRLTVKTLRDSSSKQMITVTVSTRMWVCIRPRLTVKMKKMVLLIRLRLRLRLSLMVKAVTGSTEMWQMRLLARPLVRPWIKLTVNTVTGIRLTLTILTTLYTEMWVWIILRLPLKVKTVTEMGSTKITGVRTGVEELRIKLTVKTVTVTVKIRPWVTKRVTGIWLLLLFWIWIRQVSEVKRLRLMIKKVKVTGVRLTSFFLQRLKWCMLIQMWFRLRLRLRLRLTAKKVMGGNTKAVVMVTVMGSTKMCIWIRLKQMVKTVRLRLTGVTIVMKTVTVRGIWPLARRLPGIRLKPTVKTVTGIWLLLLLLLLLFWIWIRLRLMLKTETGKGTVTVMKTVIGNMLVIMTTLSTKM
jgi:hypothetical protein